MQQILLNTKKLVQLLGAKGCNLNLCSKPAKMLNEIDGLELPNIFTIP